MWHQQANCRGKEPSWFFPEGNSNQAQLCTELARGVCQECTVITNCLEYASERKVFGIFGGKTEEERNVLFSNKFSKEAMTA
ncbi:MAG: WhiB family transcriptional regulator [Bifidobacteriaceae bacterium]|nr:WhiB family transcriptional regulator [Bifidobacteriaceae bacterium]